MGFEKLDFNVVSPYWNSRNLLEVKNRFLDQINLTMDKRKCQQLENALNQLVRNNYSDEESPELRQQLNQFINKLSNGLANVDNKDVIVKENFNVTNRKISEFYKAYSQAKKQGETDINSFIAHLENGETIDFKQVLSLNSSLNKARGDLLEKALDVIINAAGNEMDKIANLKSSELLKYLEKNPNIKTAGSRMETSSYGVTSQGKVDVEVLADNTELKISAKNYSNLRNIGLMGKSNGASVLAQWGAQGNYFMNYVASDEINAKKVDSGYIRAVHQILGIQGMVSHKGETSNIANIFVFYNRANKNPFTLVPTKEYLKHLLNKYGEKEDIFDVSYNSFFIKDGEKRLLPPIPGYPHNELNELNYENNFNEIVNNFKIAKVVLLAKYINRQSVKGFYNK